MLNATCFRILATCSLLLTLGACASSPEPRPQTSAVRTTPAIQGARAGAAAGPANIARKAAAVALQQLGAPYVYGGDSPVGFDCSGLVHYAYGRAGKAVPRTTGSLWSGTRHVSRRELETGDLLFFSIAGKMQHVGLYLGNGEFVHAPSSGRRVEIRSLDDDFYRRALLRGGRL